MNQIKCPHCNEIFSLEESSYKKILNQIKDDVIEKELHNKLENIKVKHEKQILEKEFELNKILNQKEQTVNTLEIQLELSKKELELQSQTLLSKKEKELQDLKNKLTLEKKQYILDRTNLEQNHQKQLKIKEEELQQYKDFKLKQSTKMIGES